MSSYMSYEGDVYPYKRLEGGAFQSGRQNGRMRGRGVLSPPMFGAVAEMFSPGSLLAGAVGFFLGRAVLLGDLDPFAPAYASAVSLALGRRGLPAVALLCAGLATVAGGMPLAADMTLAVMSFLFVQVVPPRFSARRPVIPALVFGLTLSVKSAFSAFTGATPYDYINVFFEALLAAVLVPACLAAFYSVRKLDGVKPLRGEETVGLLVLLAGVVAGTGDLKLWYVSVKGFLSRVVILMAALAGGSGLGAAAGAVVGAIPGLYYTVTPYMMGAYSFSGMMAGLGVALGKTGVALSFLATNIILTLYFDNIAAMETVIAETVLACLVFLLVPGTLVRRVSVAVTREPGQSKIGGGGELLASALRDRVRDYSSILRELAGSFSEITVVSEKKISDLGVRQLLGEISRKVCGGCGMYHVCWEKEYYRTYQNMLDMFTLSEMYGRVKISDMPGELKVRCTRSRELVITAACLYDAFKAGRHWEKRLSAGKALVGEQLRGISAVIENLAGEFHFDRLDGSGTGPVLKQKLKQMGLPVNSVRTWEWEGRREIIVAMKACKGELDCRYRVAPFISELLGQFFSAAGCVCEGGAAEGICKFRLYQSLQYRVEVGAAGCAKGGGNVSGDVYDFVQLKDGKFAAVLSDGMGSGESAARESASVMALTRKMLEAGLEPETVIRTVNSVLALKSPGESFATVDITVISLYSGQGEFVKIAAPPTFLIRGGRVRAIRAGSLPVGVLTDMEVGVTEKKLASRDVVVMITDGVLEAHRGSGDGDGWITGVLQELNGLEPREMAELLIKLARAGGEAGDDMAAVVIRLEKEKVVEMLR